MQDCQDELQGRFAMPRSSWFRVWAVVLLLASIAEAQPPATPPDPSPATSSATGSAQSEPPTTAPADLPGPDLLAIQVLPAPTNDEEIEERLRLLDQRLSQLPTTQPASQPASSPAEEADRQQQEVLWPLAEVVRQYRVELEAWKKIRADVVRLTSPETQARLNEQIDQYKKRRETYLTLRSEEIRYLWLPKIEELDREYNERNAEFARLNAAQTAREQQKTNLLSKQRGEVTAGVKSSLAELKQYLADSAATDLPTRLTQVLTPGEHNRLLAQKHLLEWRHNLFLLRAAALPDLQNHIDFSQRHDSALLAALGEYLAALREYRQKLEEARAKSETEYAREQLARTDLLPYMRSYWQIRLNMAQTLADFRKIDAETQDIFNQEDADQLETRIKRGKWYVTTYLESLDRRPTSGVLEIYRTAGQYLDGYRGQLAQHKQKIDFVTDRLQTAQDRRDQAVTAIYVQRTQLDKDVQKLQGEPLQVAGERLNRLIADYNQFTAAMDGIVTQLENTRDRLGKSIPLLEEHVTRLTRARVSMYRRYLLARGPNMLEMDWQTVREEWKSILTGQNSPGNMIHGSIAQFRNALRETTRSQWGGLGILVLITSVLAVRIRGKAKAWGKARTVSLEPMADFSAPPPAGIAPESEGAPATDETPDSQTRPPASEAPDLVARVQAQAAYLTASTALPVWPLIILAAGVVMMRVGGVHFVHFAGAICGVAVIFLGYQLINTLFGASRPHLRIITCTDETAAYHRRRLRLLWTVLVVAAPLPLLTYRSGFSSQIVALIWDLGTTIFLVLAVIYTLRRGYFYPLMHSPRRSATGIQWLAQSLLFLCPLILLALLALRLAGYRGLADYIFVGALFSAGVLAIGKLLRNLLASRMAEPPTVPAKTDAASGTTRPQPAHPILTLVLQIGRFLVLVGTLLLMLAIWGVSPLQIHDLLQYGLYTTGKGVVTTWRILGAVFVFVAGLLASRTIRGFLVGKVFSTNQRLDRGSQAAILILLHYSMVALAIYLALDLVFIDLGALTILFGTLGLGLGLGLQPLFVNFISGIMILLERQIKVGDLIEVNDRPGEVTAISMRSTTVRTGDNIEVVIPNAEFVTGRVINWTLNDTRIRARVEVGVAYGADVQLVRKLLLDIAYRYPDALVEPEPQVWFTNFGANSLDFTLICWFANPDSRWKFLCSIRFEILKAFRDHNIEIPFPQRTLSFAPDQTLSVRIQPETNDPPEPPGPRT